MPFEEIKGHQKRDVFKRITQRDLIPKAVKLRNSEIYQLGEETVIIYDKYRNQVFTINQSKTEGKVSFGDNAWINYIDGSSSFSNSIKEVWYPLIPQWDNSWTNQNTYQNSSGSLATINFNDLIGKSVYFEVVGKTDAGTGYYQLYNITTNTALVGSEITTTSTTEVILRSGSLTIPSGTNNICVQHKIVDGNGTTEYVNTIMARLIVRSL